MQNDDTFTDKNLLVSYSQIKSTKIKLDTLKSDVYINWDYIHIPSWYFNLFKEIEIFVLRA